jgi:hypothetical protein
MLTAELVNLLLMLYDLLLLLALSGSLLLVHVKK